MNIQFENDSWVLGELGTHTHADSKLLIGYINRDTDKLYVEKRVVEIKFGMPSPDVRYVNIDDEKDHLYYGSVINEPQFSPVFHFNAVVSNRFVLFADGSNPLSCDCVRYSEKVYKLDGDEIGEHSSVLFQAFCTRDINTIEENLNRINEKYSKIYFLTKTKMLVRDQCPNIQVVR